MMKYQPCFWNLSEVLLFKSICCLNKQKSIKPEKEGEEKVKKPRFPNILGPPRRLSRVDSTSGEEFLKCPVLLKQSEAAGRKRRICVDVISVFSTVVCLLCVQSVKPWSWTSSVRQSSSLSQPSPSPSSPTVLPPVLDGSVETSSARDRTPALNLCHPPPPLHTAPPPVRPQIPAGKTQTPVRCTSFSSSVLILLGVWQE